MRKSLSKGLMLACGLCASLVMSERAAAFGCTVNPQGVAFGTYDSVSGAAVDGVGYINLACDSPTSLEVRLSAGASGSYAARAMSASGAEMHYNLYSDVGRTAVWGDGVGGTATVSTTVSVEQDVTVYGRIAPGQNLPAGTYSDMIVVTVVY